MVVHSFGMQWHDFKEIGVGFHLDATYADGHGTVTNWELSIAPRRTYHGKTVQDLIDTLEEIKEDKDGKMKVTEVNIRHMAYTGVMAEAGFDLIEDTIKIMEEGNCDNVVRNQFYHYEKPYVFLRDVDVEPLLLESEEIFDKEKYL